MKEDFIKFSQKTISVSELNATIKSCVDSPIFKGLEIFGEISGFKFSGVHAYFTLKDKESQLSCVCFNARKTHIPKDGESVILFGSLDYYFKGGRLSLQVQSITPVGKGVLFLEFEKLKAKLFEEGLFDERHKISIPEFAKSVCVITSKTGAVIRDIVTTIRKKNPIMDIVIKDCRVQGDAAALEISKALINVDSLGYDVIIIARGGGSLEDLAPFYDETLVRTVFECKTPIVSAIGHETDFSLLDYVADLRAPTPTGAGEVVSFNYYDTIYNIKKNVVHLRFLTVKQFENKLMRAKLANQQLCFNAENFYTAKQTKMLFLLSEIKQLTISKFLDCENKTQSSISFLDNLNPLKILSRGYFSVKKDDIHIVSIKNIKIGDNIVASGADGIIKAKVTDVIL